MNILSYLLLYSFGILLFVLFVLHIIVKLKPSLGWFPKTKEETKEFLDIKKSIISYWYGDAYRVTLASLKLYNNYVSEDLDVSHSQAIHFNRIRDYAILHNWSSDYTNALFKESLEEIIEQTESSKDELVRLGNSELLSNQDLILREFRRIQDLKLYKINLLYNARSR